MANLRFDLTSGKLVFSQAGGNKLAIFCDSLSCTNCSSATPMTVDVAISGMVDFVCAEADCADIDGTWRLTRLPNACIWRYTDTGINVCGRQTMKVELSVGSIATTVNVLAGSPPAAMGVWSTTASGFQDCHSWSSFNLPAATGGIGDCTHSGATCKITKI